VSHASEDKDRFVLAFAQRLIDHGVDVWLDRWEMLPGDSLVDKIFSEGIGQAAAVIVVVSRQSLPKPWVREELDSAVVRRINQQSRLIPVVLDDIQRNELPPAIQHILFEPIANPDNYDEAFDRIVAAIFDRRSTRVPGDPPPHVRAGVQLVQGLSRLDSLVLKAAGEEAARDNGTLFITQEFLDSLAPLGVEQALLVESLEVLNTDGYIDIARTMGQGVPSMSRFSLTTWGIEIYAQTYVVEYEDLVRDVGLRLCDLSDGEQATNVQMATALGKPQLLVTHIVESLRDRGLIKATDSIGPFVHIFQVSPKLRRILSEDS